MREQTKLAQMEKEMNRYGIKIFGLSGVRWREHGAGIIIKKALKTALLAWKPISNRIMTVCFRSRINNTTIVQCYVPAEISEDEIKDEFYEQITATLSDVPKSDILILMGDFDAKVGSKPWPAVGGHVMGVRNNNGERLKETCEQHDLVVGGTIFPHKSIYKYTWVSPIYTTKNQIDHICIRRRWVKSMLDVRTWRSADAQSDRMLVTADIRIKLATRNAPANSRRKRICVQKLKSGDTKEEFVINIQQAVNSQQNMSHKQIRDVYRRVGGDHGRNMGCHRRNKENGQER
ncbi:craniofacial development protein 2-like [Condylostylus longicornis]|uniref:craniofacial development protein 2-like n=1 Tax=Condylostylus longicornis TaxID=2530218 RepID=UPI00244E1745|nr:craniofacial development protein 2-like [Condylostylus longicornis]